MKRSSTILGILAAALLLAVASFAGIKPSNNATRQEVESDTTLAVKGVLDIESGGSLKFNGTAFSASDYVPVTKAGQQSITATGAGNDITLSTLASGDDIIAQAGGDISLEPADNFNVSAAGNISIYHTGNDGGLNVESNFTAMLSPDSNTALFVRDTGITAAGAFRISPSAAPPVACAGETEGTLYLDSDTHLLCVCNGTGWVQVADGSTACS